MVCGVWRTLSLCAPSSSLTYYYLCTSSAGGWGWVHRTLLPSVLPLPSHLFGHRLSVCMPVVELPLLMRCPCLSRALRLPREIVNSGCDP